MKPSHMRCNSRATWMHRLADKFVGMYVNHFTLDAGDIVPAAVQKMLDLGFEVGLIPKRVKSNSCAERDRLAPAPLSARICFYG